MRVLNVTQAAEWESIRGEAEQGVGAAARVRGRRASGRMIDWVLARCSIHASQLPARIAQQPSLRETVAFSKYTVLGEETGFGLRMPITKYTRK